LFAGSGRLDETGELQVLVHRYLALMKVAIKVQEKGRRNIVRRAAAVNKLEYHFAFVHPQDLPSIHIHP
jgi:hypothetical protein